MKRFFAVLILLIMGSQVSAQSHFASTAGDIQELLQNPVFHRYAAFTIANIRQGELGQAQAFFIRLVRPSAISEKGVCIEFVKTSNWVVKGHPYACDEE